MSFRVWPKSTFATCQRFSKTSKIYQHSSLPTYTTSTRSHVSPKLCARARVSMSLVPTLPDERQWHRATFRVLAGFHSASRRRRESRGALKKWRRTIKNDTWGVIVIFRDRSRDCRRCSVARAAYMRFVSLEFRIGLCSVVSAVIIMQLSRATRAAASNSAIYPFHIKSAFPRQDNSGALIWWRSSSIPGKKKYFLPLFCIYIYTHIYTLPQSSLLIYIQINLKHNNIFNIAKLSISFPILNIFCPKKFLFQIVTLNIRARRPR